jgi:5-formyltetrahydrofolate cyclo-ligase
MASQHETAVYIQVTNALRSLALANPWDSDGILPAEPALMERFQVSRGTVRRATEELVREGLLRPDRGRGTYIIRQAQLRALMRDTLGAIAIPDSRWHLDVVKFVPDFVGSSLAHERARGMAEYGHARTIFIAPDNSLTGLIISALNDGKHVVVPTYAMRRGMVLLDPAVIPPEHREFASTLDGLERFGRRLGVDDLRALGRIDMVVTGGIAFTKGGVHVGSGEAYIDLEWGILSTLGLVSADTSTIGLAHADQVVDVILVPEPLNLCVDFIVTPDKIAVIQPGYPRPTGISWPHIGAERLNSISYLRELRPTNTEWTPRP